VPFFFFSMYGFPLFFSLRTPWLQFVSQQVSFSFFRCPPMGKGFYCPVFVFFFTVEFNGLFFFFFSPLFLFDLFFSLVPPMFSNPLFPPPEVGHAGPKIFEVPQTFDYSPFVLFLMGTGFFLVVWPFFKTRTFCATLMV